MSRLVRAAASASGAAPAAASGAARSFGAGVPVWVAVGQFSIFAFVATGFEVLGVPVNPKPGFLVTMMLLAGIVLMAPRGLLGKVHLSGTVALFFAWWGASFAWSPLPGEWINITITQLSWAALLMVIASTLPRDKIVSALLFTVYAMVVWTFVYTAMHPGESTVLLNGSTGELVNVGWRGPFGHKNVMASFMITGMLVVLTFEQRVGRRRSAVLAMVALVLLSRSGTGAGGMIAALAVVAFARRVSKATGRKLGVTVVLAGMSTVVALVGVVTSLPAIVALYGKDLTFTGRTEIWSAALQAIYRKPWTGYSWGGVWIDPSKEPTFTIVRRLGFIVFHAHNGPIELMLELGVVGLALYAAMFGSVVRDGWRLLHRDPAIAQLVLGFCALVFVTSISEVLVVGPWLSLLLFLRTLALRSLHETRNAPATTASHAPSALPPRSHTARAG
jgi:O-antigen ligase